MLKEYSKFSFLRVVNKYTERESEFVRDVSYRSFVFFAQMCNTSKIPLEVSSVLLKRPTYVQNRACKNKQTIFHDYQVKKVVCYKKYCLFWIKSPWSNISDCVKWLILHKRPEHNDVTPLYFIILYYVCYIFWALMGWIHLPIVLILIQVTSQWQGTTIYPFMYAYR